MAKRSHGKPCGRERQGVTVALGYTAAMPPRRAPRPFSEAYATLESLNALAAAWNRSPPLQRLGARLEFQRVDRVRVVLDPVQMFHRGGIGTEAINGTVLAGLFDLAIGTVGWLASSESRSATVTLAMTFFRPTRGDRVAVEARLIRAGTNLMFAAAEIFDERGDVTARCDGTVAVARGRAGDGEFAVQMRGTRSRAGGEPARDETARGPAAKKRGAAGSTASRASSPPRGSAPRRPRSPRPSSRSRG